MRWEVEYTDEFEAWWHTLSEEEQVSVAATVPVADQFYDQHLAQIRGEGLIHD